MKQALALFALLFSLNSFAACSKEEAFKQALIVGGLGVAAGVVTGVVVASTASVGVVGGPLAITYFTVGAGSANLGAWVSAAVIPTVTLASITMGSMGSTIGLGHYLEKNCLK